MKRLTFLAAIVTWTVFSFVPVVRAHFQALIPSDDMVTKSDSKIITLDVAFFHPFQGHYMDMAKPARFGVMVHGRKQISPEP